METLTEIMALQKKEKDMLNISTSAKQMTYRKPGRPMKIGKLVFDKNNIHNVGIFVGTCNNCNDKVIISQTEAEQFARTYWQDKNSVTRRLLRWITRDRSI